MKPCCSLISPYSLEETRERILSLRGISGLKINSKKTLRLAYTPQNGVEKPLLGSPAWDLSIECKDMGTVVSFHWVIPGFSWTIFTLIGQIPWIFSLGLHLQLSPFTLGLGIFGLIWPLFLGFSAWNTRRGSTFQSLKQIMRDTLDAL